MLCAKTLLVLEDIKTRMVHDNKSGYPFRGNSWIGVALSLAKAMVEVTSPLQDASVVFNRVCLFAQHVEGIVKVDVQLNEFDHVSIETQNAMDALLNVLLQKTCSIHAPEPHKQLLIRYLSTDMFNYWSNLGQHENARRVYELVGGVEFVSGESTIQYGTVDVFTKIMNEYDVFLQVSSVLSSIVKANDTVQSIPDTDARLQLALSELSVAPTERKKPTKTQIKNDFERATWNVYIGEYATVHKCLCCKTKKISRNNFSCGYVIPLSVGGSNTVDNTRPICDDCKRSIGTRSIVEFALEHNFGKIPGPKQ